MDTAKLPIIPGIGFNCPEGFGSAGTCLPASPASWWDRCLTLDGLWLCCRLAPAISRTKYVAVDENRDVALLFADDIARGLLGHIYQNLGEQNAKAKLALSVLKDCIKDSHSGRSFEISPAMVRRGRARSTPFDFPL